MRKRGFYFTLGTVIILSIFIASPVTAGAKSIKLTACSYVPESHPASKAITWWLDIIEKETKGRLKFDKFYGGALLPGPDTVAGIGKGIADFGMVSPGYVPGMFPLSMVGFLPYVTSNPYAFAKARIALYDMFPEKQAEFEKANLHWVMPVCTAPGYLSVRKPVRTIKDLKGLKIRGYGYATKAIGLLGASPAAISFGETFTALQTGVVDGAIGSSGDIYSQKWYEVAKNLVDIDFGMYIVCVWAFNKNSWNKLPNDLKKVVEKNVEMYLKKETEFYDRLGTKWLEQSKAIGCDLHMWSDEEKARAKEMVLEPIFDSWINEIPKYKDLRQKVAKKYRELVSKYEVAGGEVFNPFAKFLKK